MHAVNERHTTVLLGQQCGHTAVGEQHQVFDKHMGFLALLYIQSRRHELFIQDEFHFLRFKGYGAFGKFLFAQSQCDLIDG